MNHHMMFGVPLFRYHLDPTKLKQIAEERFSDNKDLPLDHSPSYWDCDMKTDFHSSRANKYNDFYNDVLDEFGKDVGLTDAYPTIHESWLNMYTKGMNQEEHDHLPSFYSAVHFVKFNPKVHESVYLINPLHQLYNATYSCAAACRNAESALDAHEFTKQFHLPDIVEGDIIIFPSFLRHRVNTQKSDETRITLAFNINTLQGSVRRVFGQ
tara:strand:- start:279 stop:911 length:633 start_codon:yes stop_codon:yes gene_type:complete